MKIVIYKITSPSGKVYIGRTKNFDQRMIEHKCKALTTKAKNTLYKAVRKYGWDNMKKEIICTVDKKEAQLLEEEMIKLNNSVKKGYNDTYSGGGGDHWEGRKDTDKYMEWIERMIVINTGESNGMYGKSHKKSTISEMKVKAKGRFSLPWFIAKYGKEDGTLKHFERGQFLKNRPVKKK